MKKVSIATVDARKFVEDLLTLGKQGAVIDDSCIAYKGFMLRAEVMVSKSVPVETNERVQVSAEYVAEQVSLKENKDAKEDKSAETKQVDNLEVDKKWTAEELDALTIKEVKEITGLNGRDKSKMIEEYLGK